MRPPTGRLASAAKRFLTAERLARPWRATSPAALLASLLLVVLVPAASAAHQSVPRGALHALTGPGACLGTGAGCGRLRGARDLGTIAISPDGRTLYLAAPDGIAVLARDRRTGRLRQLRGRAGCLRRDGTDGCTLVRGLRGPGSIGVSPDGRSVYVTSTDGIVGFARNRRTGAIRAIAGRGGCLDARPSSCARLRGVTNPSLLVAPDRRTVYLAGTESSGKASWRGALAVLSRDPATGRLTQLAGGEGCANGAGTQGCGSAPCLNAHSVMAVSRDGRHLYAASSDATDVEFTTPGAVATFTRAPGTGALTLIGCVVRNDAVSDLAVAPAGDAVFVAAVFGNRGSGVAHAGIDLYTPAAGGALARRRQLACSDSSGRRCSIPFGPDTETLALSPSGNTLYVSELDAGLAVLHVSRAGLARLPGRWGCVVSASTYMPPPRCGHTRPLLAGAMVASPDGRNLYVATLGDGHGIYYAGGVTGFSIQR